MPHFGNSIDKLYPSKEVIYERREGGLVLLNPSNLVEQGSLSRLIVRSYGIDPDYLFFLLSKEIDVANAEFYPIDNKQGRAENIYWTQEQHPDYDKVDVSRIEWLPAAVKPKDNLSVHMKGFEVIYIESGNAEIEFATIDDSYTDEEGNFYAANERRHKITIGPGTVVVIPSEIPNGWSYICDEGITGKYICTPPWDESFVRPVKDRPDYVAD